MELIKTNNLPQTINQKAVEKVNAHLAEVEEKTRAFDRQNSQTTLSLMTLTMMTGQSPYRMMRQVMAEIEKRKLALAESQVTYAKNLQELQELEGKDDMVSVAEYRHKSVLLKTLENKINGSFKDIATLLDSYYSIKEKNGIEDWDEKAFEVEEKKHHVRRGFELMYRNLMQGGRAEKSTLEYLQQYGVHPQVCLAEVSGYIKHTSERVAKKELIHANDLEDFLDQMAEKYHGNVDKTSERLFGKADFLNTDYMYQLEAKNEAD